MNNEITPIPSDQSHHLTNEDKAAGGYQFDSPAKEMTALDIYEAAFHSDQAEWIPTDYDQLIKHVENCADNALGTPISCAVAIEIVKAYLSYKGLDEDDGEYPMAYDERIRKPLEQIKI